MPVLIVSEGEAVAASLIENREREDMHIADESVAFRLLIDEGRSVAHVAFFGMSELAVRRSLKLASLSPTLLEAFRTDQMDFEQAAALALAEDHGTQEQVWGEAREPWQRAPRELRAAITTTEIDASRSHLAKFVGIEVYEAAGGTCAATCSAMRRTPGLSLIRACCTGWRRSVLSPPHRRLRARAGPGSRRGLAATITNHSALRVYIQCRANRRPRSRLSSMR